MMPGIDGVDLVRRLRRSGRQTPVLVLTARDSPEDVVRGLDAGADDYLTKPFSFRVFLARLRALARRSERPYVARLQVDDLVLDPASHQVTRAGTSIALTATEYRLLEFLMRRVGHAVSRSAIIEGVWGFEEDIEPNTVDAFIRLLREKLDAGRQRRIIQTVRGYGYILREDG
jgi:two-component system response regulator MprA